MLLSKLPMSTYHEDTVGTALQALSSCSAEQKIRKWKLWLLFKDEEEVPPSLYPILLDFEKYLRSSEESFISVKGSWFRMVFYLILYFFFTSS